MSETNWNLVPLTPEYIEDEHGGYVAELENALKNDEIRNIALSGPYGVGKSSILRELARRLKGRVVELSLSTLAATRPPESEELDEAVPIQATTTTNRIQQEIVKQLLYRMDPAKARASRFHRIERFRCPRAIGIATLFGLFITIAFLLTGWTERIATTFDALASFGAWPHLVIWGGATAALLILQRLFYGKIQIKQLSAGTASVTLDDNSVSYFDQYLDEIVYFFTVTDHDVVILEDIDRFNDSHIFETLRELNILLNASPQVKKTIRFIYAIKDSIFDQDRLRQEGRQVEPGAFSVDGSVHAEVALANRTKFFDLIIPVVPFIAHHNARDLLKRLLGDDHGVEIDLVDLAAKYLPDMRLLKNVCNEFIVFRDRIISTDSEQLNLDETELFAMMLYKNTHLADFEKIRLGTSNLDKLYKLSREFTAQNIQRLEQEIHERELQIDSTELLDRNSVVLQPLEIDDPEEYDSLSHDGLSEYEELVADTIGKREDIAFLRGADLSGLIKRPKFHMDIKENATSLHKETLTNDKIASKPFSYYAKAILSPGLAYELVRTGYINRSFTLFTSRFYGVSVSPAAMNFIIHHVEPRQMEPYLVLAPQDVDTVIRECGENELAEPGCYNISILDHLLATGDNKANILFQPLARPDQDATDFVRIYLLHGTHRPEFIRQLTPMMPAVLSQLARLPLDEYSRQELMDIALASLSLPEDDVLPSSQVLFDNGLAEHLWEHYAEYSVLTKDGTPEQAKRIAMLFADNDIQVPKLRPLSKNARTAFISRSLYDITSENLAIAIDNEETVALDAIQGKNEAVYDYMLKNLCEYLKAVDGFSSTIDKNEQFIRILEDLLKKDESQTAEEPIPINEVIEHAARECQVQDLADISDKAWQALALHRHFPATCNNLSQYLDAFGIEENLASLLSHTVEVTEVDSVDAQEKTDLAIEILAAKEHLPSASIRADLVASLQLGHPLNTEKIDAEPGDLFALLLQHNIISDNGTSYEHLLTADWPTRKAFILRSKKFTSYMTPELLKPDLGEILSDDDLNDEIKQTIVENSEEYVEIADHDEINKLARLTLAYEEIAPFEVIAKMAQRGVLAEHVIRLLNPHLDTLDIEELHSVLHDLGGYYRKLTIRDGSRPRIPNTEENRTLLKFLEQHGNISSYDSEASSIKVYMRRK
ncbi:hypothetical protein HMPREF3160_04915 [Arthrobacter sp. HMSC06H05]|uniref:YobI family P-loop NTPase n=1 Tax=Arthrobacter sp. HMSC06H05 TaxID=1581128 RepID=UPI0008CF4BA5|nr:AAA family ATPase [Arthrobacter sp. HMSC06H05]OFT42675.1 hypothetical protein HMPREF3160_04915 [Arthrobacter sp. HMSC06H05]